MSNLGFFFSFHKQFMENGRFNKVWKKVCIEYQTCDVQVPFPLAKMYHGAKQLPCSHTIIIFQKTWYYHGTFFYQLTVVLVYRYVLSLIKDTLLNYGLYLFSTLKVINYFLL